MLPRPGARELFECTVRLLGPGEAHERHCADHPYPENRLLLFFCASRWIVLEAARHVVARDDVQMASHVLLLCDYVLSPAIPPGTDCDSLWPECICEDTTDREVGYPYSVPRRCSCVSLSNELTSNELTSLFTHAPSRVSQCMWSRHSCSAPNVNISPTGTPRRTERVGWKGGKKAWQ